MFTVFSPNIHNYGLYLKKYFLFLKGTVMAKKYITEKQRVTRVLVAGLLAVVILAAAFIGGGILYSNYLNSGSSQRNMIAFESDNYEINNCMMTYYYFSDFYNTYNQYGSYFSAMGLDPHTSMKTQSYDEESSWFDYFINNSANTASGYLLYAEAARENNFKLDNLDELVDKQITNLKDTATELELDFDKYLTNIFGAGIKESDIRDALELQIYASEYYEAVEDDYAASLTDEDYEKYYKDNTNSLNKVDYRSYTISANVAEDASEEDKNAAYAEAKAEAELLKKEAATVEGFTAWVSANLTEKNGDLETPLKEEEIKEKAEAVTEAAAYAEGDFSTWAFDAARAAGDVTLIDDGAGNYTVYRLEKTAYRVEDETKDVRHILITADTYGSDAEAKAKADEILATYKAGDKTADAFDALAEEFNEDSGSLYENVAQGQMVEAFDSWIFDEKRVAGDTDVVKTDYGYHVMYFVGDGQAQWQVDAYSAMLESYISELVEGYQDKYAIDIDYNAVYALPDAIPTTAFQSSGTSVEDQQTTAPVTETADAGETVEALDEPQAPETTEVK